MFDDRYSKSPSFLFSFTQPKNVCRVPIAYPPSKYSFHADLLDVYYVLEVE